MKILHSSDWHIGNFPGPEKDGKNLRALDTELCIHHLICTATHKRPDVVIIAGDLFHQARVWADRGLSEVKTAIEAITTLSTICPVIVMRGTPNHDGSEQFEMLRSAFTKNKDVYIVTSPQILTIPQVTNKSDTTFAILPGFDRGVFRAKFPGLSKDEENIVFTEELGKMVLALRAQCSEISSGPHVLVSHYTIPGCNLESGQTQFFSQFEPVIAPEILDAAKFDIVCMGHIHRPQKLQTCRNAYYSGALNAMNFNDEGQERGFWVHTLDSSSAESEFCETPYREFLTMRMDDGDISAFNNDGAFFYGLQENSNGGINEKIVRIIYNCSEENNKALNRALMEKCLYDNGAFWVSEISPEQINIGTVKNELSDLLDPETNLITYLSAKGKTQEQIGTVVDAARPIIAEALSGAITTRLTGIFTPLEIEVKNYRNYAEEHFDFRDISFCTINGKNGSGKSSLFMDAILDCLYEVPREGDLTGWIRADESARSGSISFTFAIGDKTFRVTRTRAKSGKATLNLSEKVKDEWADRSSERQRDTQDAIVNVLGMDSLTFRSCALIMQDQYGLFLQADKEDRMSILGNILGLGIYNDMEQLARVRASDAGRDIARRKTVIDTLSREITDEDVISDNLQAAKQKAELLAEEKASLEKERDDIRAEIAKRNDIRERADTLHSEIVTLDDAESGYRKSIEAQKQIISEAEATLSFEDVIREKASKHPTLLEEEKELIQQIASVNTQIAECADAQAEADRINQEIEKLSAEQESVGSRISACDEKLSAEDELRKAADEYKGLLEKLSELDTKSQEYIPLSEKFGDARAEYSAAQSMFNHNASGRKTKIESLEAKAAMLTSSGCPDPDNADCKFLKDAKAAKAELGPYREECSEWKEKETERIQELKNKQTEIEAQLNAIGYDPEVHKSLRFAASSKEKRAKEYEQLSSVREQLTLLREQQATLAVTASSLQERLSKVTERAERGRKLAVERSDLGELRTNIASEIETAAGWVEREKQLPIARERVTAANARITEIRSEFEKVTQSKIDKKQLLDILLAQADTSSFAAKLRETDNTLRQNDIRATSLKMDIGRFTQRLEDIKKKKSEIATITDEISIYADKAAIFDTLKAAFSQDGIPHNIIRTVLPTLSATANNILGMMTGGKMGIDFVTDKVLKSNSKKEVPTLDIVIEEYGKDTLPYLSKSGGEKVKASLSVILSLAETKSSQAGVQLGMLFIDEPPFLDADGVGAYCDALETIQRRYSGLKVMAITHDPTFKARFPQSIDIIKTENGSRVEAA